MKQNNLRNEVYSLLTKSEKDWKFDKHTAIHIPTNSEWWIANGFVWFNNEDSRQSGDYKIKIGLVNRYRLYRWLKNAMLKQFIDKCTK